MPPDGIPFSVEMEVRDYECDLQGVVNNANYLHYLEHARHLFLKARGIDFAEWATRGVHLVLTRAEVDFRQPLRSGDRFRVVVQVERESRLRFAFPQEIVRLSDDRIVVRARMIGTAIDRRGRPSLPGEIAGLLGFVDP